MYITAITLVLMSTLSIKTLSFERLIAVLIESSETELCGKSVPDSVVTFI